MFTRDRSEHRSASRCLQGPHLMRVLHHICVCQSTDCSCCCRSRLQVKADRNNRKLYTLQQASRHVNDMAAVVVTSSKHGQQKVSDHGEASSSCLMSLKPK